MLHRWFVAVPCLITLSSVVALAQSAPTPAPREARTIVYRPRDLIALHPKLHFTTLIVLPEGEDVVEATCGDKEFWIVNVRGGLISVKPAKIGGETNLNVVTTSGQVYAFLLTETSLDKGQDADLTVYLEADDLSATAASRLHQKFVPAEQVEDFRAQADLA